MDNKKGKILVIALFLVDMIISTGVILYKSYLFKTGFNNDIFRILFDLLIISLAFYGVRWMKGIYMALLILTGVIYLFLSVGIFISESVKLYGLSLLCAGIYHIVVFFLLVYSKLINDFFDDQQMKFKMKYNNLEIKK